MLICNENNSAERKEIIIIGERGKTSGSMSLVGEGTRSGTKVPQQAFKYS